MKIRELIINLEKYDPEQEVYIADYSESTMTQPTDVNEEDEYVWKYENKLSPERVQTGRRIVVIS